MMSAIMNILRAYERHSLVVIEPWTLVDINDTDLGYNPNEQLNWRNQPAAHTDCVLQYKASADFIIVSDIDDILFVKLGRNFHEEFSGLLSLAPQASGFSYNRYNAEYVSSRDAPHYSLSGLLATANLTNERVGPKAVVVPPRIQTMWLHHPIHVDKGYRMVTVPETMNAMVHFRTWTGVDQGSGWVRDTLRGPHDIHTVHNLISPSKQLFMESGFRRFLNESGSVDMFSRLPATIVYSAVIEKCYTKMYFQYYKRVNQVEKCPGPVRCEVPDIEGIECDVAAKEIDHEMFGDNAFVHFARFPPTFTRSSNGCRM